MKKVNILIAASLAAASLVGGVLFANSVSAADLSHPPKAEQQKMEPPKAGQPAPSIGQPAAPVNKEKKDELKVKKEKAPKDKKHVEEKKEEKQAPQQKKMKPWEEKYYEQHPEAKEQDEHKGDSGKRTVQDDDGNNWHRI